jgi:hypothetical protein
MGMMEALIEDQRRRDAVAAAAAARQAELHGHEASHMARVVIHATIEQEAAQRARVALGDALDRDVIAIGIHDMVTSRATRWTGTVVELLREIGQPTMNARHAGRRLRRIARTLLRSGIRIRTWPSNCQRLISIELREQPSDCSGLQTVQTCEGCRF